MTTPSIPAGSNMTLKCQILRAVLVSSATLLLATRTTSAQHAHHDAKGAHAGPSRHAAEPHRAEPHRANEDRRSTERQEPRQHSQSEEQHRPGGIRSFGQHAPEREAPVHQPPVHQPKSTSHHPAGHQPKPGTHVPANVPHNSAGGMMSVAPSQPVNPPVLNTNSRRPDDDRRDKDRDDDRFGKTPGDERRDANRGAPVHPMPLLPIPVLPMPAGPAKRAVHAKAPGARPAGAKLPIPEPGELRMWTDNTGRFTTSARFAGLVNSSVVLVKADNARVEVPLDRLSVADQDWVESRRAPQ